MITRKELADRLIKYADRDFCGTPSLGFIPSLLFARWAWDNQNDFNSRVWNAQWTWENPWTTGYHEFKQKYSTEDFFKNPLTAENIQMKARSLTGLCRPLKLDDDVERIFMADINHIKSGHVLYKRCQEACEEIASLDLSAKSISTADVAAALDDYLDSFDTSVSQEKTYSSLANRVVAKLVARLAEMNTNVVEKSIFDPFCKFGHLLEESGRGLKKIAAAESKVYTTITFIRMILRDMPVKLAPISSIQHPLTKEDGEMARYHFVVTNISGIGNDTESVAFQMDPHHRFQTLLPTTNSLNTVSAAINAWSFTKLRGLCFIICSRDEKNAFYKSGIFSEMTSEGTLRPFLAQDYIRAVIKIPPTDSHGRVSKEINHFFKNRCVYEIYVLSRMKFHGRSNKIQFIDASSCTSESEVIDNVTDAFINKKEIPGFSVMVPIDKVTESKLPILRPEWFTCTIEQPKCEDIGKLNRELERLEKQGESVTVDIHNVVRTLCGEVG